jgi:UDP-GlcNAc3NAcA epimerase
MERLSVLSVVGARPQFIKAAALHRAWDLPIGGDARRIDVRLLHTGQHYDHGMSDVFFRDLDLRRPDHELGVGSGAHGAQTGRMLAGIEEVLQRERPDLVLVFGDTNSTLAGALAAAKLAIPVAHVEAGLRSNRRAMAEEINRVMTDHVATLLFCPSRLAVDNLRREGITDGVHEVGDVMFDVLLHYLPEPMERKRVVNSHGLKEGSYALVTIHRAENTDDPEQMETIVAALEKVASCGIDVVFPIHPRTKKALDRADLPPGIHVISPVSYREMLSLEAEAHVILTDSGGVQKEAFWLGVPCVTMREETEWVETVELGWNVVSGIEPDAVVMAATRDQPTGSRPPVYGKGDAANRIVDVLAAWIGEPPLPIGRQTLGVPS